MLAVMQSDQIPAAPAPAPDVPGDPSAEQPLGGRHRSHLGEPRPHRRTARFTAGELAEVAAAAASVGMTAGGFCAESAVAAARGMPMVLTDAQYRVELARLQRQLFEARTAVVRFGVNVNQAVAQLHSAGTAPEWMARAVRRTEASLDLLDEVIGEVDRRLR